MALPRTRSLRSGSLVALAVLLLGAILSTRAVLRIDRASAEATVHGDEARRAGADFAVSLQGRAAERQLAHLDARRESYQRLAAARRERALGIFLVFLALLGLAGTFVSRRIEREVLPDPRAPPPVEGG